MSSGTAEIVRAHVAAFNAHDTDAVLAGLSADARWSTGSDVASGQEELADVFDAWLWSLDPHLELRSLIVDGDRAAAELVERITVDGERREFWIAAFLTIDDGLISDAKVYREGTADIDG